MVEKFSRAFWIIKKSGLFDEAYYLKQYEDVRKGDWNPLVHYILHGWKEGRNPTPWFDNKFYLENNPDVAKTGVNPFEHWIRWGRKEGRRPNQIMNYNDTFFIKQGYIANLNPEYFVDFSDQIEYQPYVYQLAKYLAERGEKKYIIDLGAGNGSKLVKYFLNSDKSDINIIGVDYGKNLSYINKIDKFQVIQFNLEEGLPNIDNEILKNTVVIAADVIEHLKNPHNFLKGLSLWSKITPYILISTPDRIRARGIEHNGPPPNLAHVREWSLQEFFELLKYYDFGNFLIGYTINNNLNKQKATILSISGEEVNYKSTILKKVLAIIHCYNEKDIIGETVDHLLHQGLDVCVIDNCSADGTYELLLEKYKNNKRVYIRRSENYDNKYKWSLLLKITENITHEFRNFYDWFMHCDADEIRYSPYSEITLQEMISFVDFLGYNAIDFTVIDFRFTDEDENTNSNYVNNLTYFEFCKRPGCFQQIKCWKYAHDINLANSGGHEAYFNNRKIYPIKFLIKHYALRNKEQAYKKIFLDRMNRLDEEERKKGWHIQYDEYVKKGKIEFNKNCLIKFNQNIFKIEYLVERISGIGIRDD